MGQVDGASIDLAAADGPIEIVQYLLNFYNFSCADLIYWGNSARSHEYFDLANFFETKHEFCNPRGYDCLYGYLK